MVRAAAKNFRDVLVVVSPDDYARGARGARRAGGAVAGVPVRPRPHGVRAHGGVRRRDRVHARDDHAAGGRDRRPRPGADRRRVAPRARAAASCATSATARTRTSRRRGTRPRPTGSAAPTVLQGKELSYTNLLDLDSAARIVARVHRAGRRRHQAHQPVRRGDRAPRSRRPTCARAKPTRSRRSAASSG